MHKAINVRSSELHSALLDENNRQAYKEVPLIDDLFLTKRFAVGFIISVFLALSSC